MSNEQKCVWYSPECNEIRVAPKGAAYVFKDEIGEYHLCYRYEPTPPGKESLIIKAFYLIGNL
jgi:hypothetical protein